MTEFLAFFVVLAAGLIVSEIFGRLHLPLVVALIIGGILIGPFGLDLFTLNTTIEFLGQIGLVFLMFMAGLETKLSSFNEYKTEVVKVSLLNGLIPLAAGIGIALWVGLGWIPAFLLGIIFISSSIAIVVPSLQANALLSIRLGRVIIASTIVLDIASLVFLLVLLRTLESGQAILPDILFYPLIILSIIALRWLIPRIHMLFMLGAKKHDLFEKEVRIILVSLIGTVAFLELMGVHAIIAGFFTGLVFSETLKSKILKEKLRTLGYGLFVPIFFIVVGAQTNIQVFSEVGGGQALALTGLIVGGSILSKFISGWIGGKIGKFTSKDSMIIGAATIPQLSTTLAVVAIGHQKGLLNDQLVAAMVVLSIVTTFIAPLLVGSLTKKPQVEIIGPVEENYARRNKVATRGKVRR